ncbi:hypothetical protein NMY22_g11705 [Coprinellus aureogranulatus]|nr:hypothetical protein NMY22_g11705 [Coprinellus aureogranulatus]
MINVSQRLHGAFHEARIEADGIYNTLWAATPQSLICSGIPMSTSQQDTDVDMTNTTRGAGLAGVGGGETAVTPHSLPPTPASLALCAGLVLEEIMERVCRGGNPKRTLLNLALANKSGLLDPVMDRVWGTMHSLAPFFLLLPHDETSFLGAKKIIMTSEPPTSFTAFTKYAKRLRYLVFEGGSASDSIPLLSKVRLACLQSQDHPFFPSLESITFTSPEVGQYLAASVELLPFCSISSLDFTNLQIETATLVTVFSFFSLRFADSLKNLRLQMPITERQFGMPSLRYLTKLRGLQTLSIGCRNSDFPVFELIPWILSLSSLRTLELDIAVNRLLPHEYADLRSASRVLNILRLAGDVNFIGTILRSFGGGRDAIGVQGTVIFLTATPLHPTHQDQLTTFIHDNFPAQPSVRFESPATQSAL